MSIFTKRSTGVIDILASDTVIYTVEALERIAISAMTSDSTAAATVEFFSSADDTSAAGDRLTSLTFTADGEALDISALISQGFDAGTRIIAKGSGTGVNVKMSYTLYTGDDV
jgi:hypothetical protein